MVWPPYSPDIAPIENLWGIVKKKLYKAHNNNRQELIERLEQIWSTDETVKEACKALVDGMSSRI